jgi:histone H2A
VLKHQSSGRKTVREAHLRNAGVPLDDDSNQQSRSRKAGLQFDVDQIGILMCTHTGHNIGEHAALYLAAVVEYMTAEVLELGGNRARDSWVEELVNGETCCVTIRPRHLQLTLRMDEEFDSFCRNIQILDGGVVLPSIPAVLLRVSYPAFVDIKAAQKEVTALETEERITSQAEDRREKVLTGHYESYVGNWVYGSGRSGNEGSEGGEGGEGSEMSNVLNRGAIEALKAPYCTSLRPVHGIRDWRPCCAGYLDGEAGALHKKGLVSVALGGEGYSSQLSGSTAPFCFPFDGRERGIRDAWKGVRKHHFQRLAARAGVVQMHAGVYDESRNVLQKFLESIVCDAVALAEHQRTFVVTPEHVLAGGRGAERYGVCLWGTGRWPLKQQGMHRHQFRGFLDAYKQSASTRATELKFWGTADAVAFEPNEWRKYHGHLSVADFQEAEATGKQREEEGRKEWVREDEERIQQEQTRGKEAQRNKTQQTEEFKGETQAAKKSIRWHTESLGLIRKMRFLSTERLIPFGVVARAIEQIGQEIGHTTRNARSYIWSPVAINLIDAMAEHYLVGVYADANLNAMHGGRTVVQQADLHLARRVGRERW